MVKSLKQTKGQPNEYIYIPFAQSLGGFYEPIPIPGSTTLRFKKVMYHEAPNSVDLRFPTGFINATHFECTFKDAFNEKTQNFIIQLDDALNNISISDYSKIDVSFYHSSRNIIVDYTLDPQNKKLQFYPSFNFETITDDELSEFSVRIIAYQKVHKLVFNTYYEEK